MTRAERESEQGASLLVKLEAWIRELTQERDAALTQTRHAEAHGVTCHTCDAIINVYAATPSLWPVAMCYAEEPGVVKWTCEGCVSRWREERDEARAERDRLKGQLSRSERERETRKLLEALVLHPESFETWDAAKSYLALTRGTPCL